MDVKTGGLKLCVLMRQSIRFLWPYWLLTRGTSCSRVASPSAQKIIRGELDKLLIVSFFHESVSIAENSYLYEVSYMALPVAEHQLRDD